MDTPGCSVSVPAAAVAARVRLVHGLTGRGAAGTTMAGAMGPADPGETADGAMGIAAFDAEAIVGAGTTGAVGAPGTG